MATFCKCNLTDYVMDNLNSLHESLVTRQTAIIYLVEGYDDCVNTNSDH